MIRLKAYAKVNLFLEVTGRRKDGYHTLETLFAKVALHDDLSVRALPGPRRVELKVRDLTGTKVPSGPENLAARAARAYLDRYDIDKGVAVSLVKRIPAGGGLGGGSSDAGTVLRAMAGLFPKPGSLKELGRLGSELGADVPFFTQAGSFCIGKGVGDRLTPIPRPAGLRHVVLVDPGTPVATADAYRALALLRRKSRLTGRRHLDKIEPQKRLFNRLEEAVLPLYPAVRDAKAALTALGAEPLMSGSGSCVFALAPNAAVSRRWAARMKARGLRAWAVRFV